MPKEKQRKNQPSEREWLDSANLSPDDFDEPAAPEEPPPVSGRDDKRPEERRGS